VLRTGGWQRRHTVGGQLVYPTQDEGWTPSGELRAAVDGALREANSAGYAALSIDLGGAVVLAADEPGLTSLKAALPPVVRGRTRFPLSLPGHSAFHTPLMAPMAAELEQTPPFAPTTSPLVDGSGRLWPAGGEACDVAALREYTIHEQVVAPYRFAHSLETAIGALDPEVLVLLGPGSGLGGAIGQVLSRMRWRGIDSKAAFAQAQRSDRPALITLPPAGAAPAAEAAEERPLAINE